MTISSRSLPYILTLHQLIVITRDPMIKIWKKQMKMICSTDELNAYYCQRDDIERSKSCQQKVVKIVARENNEDDRTICKTYVSQWEQEHAVDNQKLFKAFDQISFHFFSFFNK
ncbi:hypothetical protein I4U23_030218 [Adineta vaga]|nr:hypothetical protein I4U23_030218 [Adineta vaga]